MKGNFDSGAMVALVLVRPSLLTIMLILSFTRMACLTVTSYSSITTTFSIVSDTKNNYYSRWIESMYYSYVLWYCS